MSDCVNRKASPSYLCFGPTRVMDARRLPGTAAGGGHHVGRRGGRGRRSLVPSASPVSLVFVLEQHTQRVPCLRANVAPWRHGDIERYQYMKLSHRHVHHFLTQFGGHTSIVFAQFRPGTNERTDRRHLFAVAAAAAAARHHHPLLHTVLGSTWASNNSVLL